MMALCSARPVARRSSGSQGWAGALGRDLGYTCRIVDPSHRVAVRLIDEQPQTARFRPI
jgi:hypothetical protein